MIHYVFDDRVNESSSRDGAHPFYLLYGLVENRLEGGVTRGLIENRWLRLFYQRILAHHKVEIGFNFQKEALTDDSAYRSRIIEGIKLSVIKFKERIHIRHLHIANIRIDRQGNPVLIDYYVRLRGSGGVQRSWVQFDYISQFMGQHIEPLSLIGDWIFQKWSYH